MTRAGLALIAAALIIAGGSACSAAGNMMPPSATPTTTAPSLPPGGVFLTDLGFTEAPPSFSVPAAAKMVTGYNIPDLINVIYDGADGPIVHDYLAKYLPDMGFTITGQSDDSLLWNGPGWTGAFTMTSLQAGLTLRHIA